MVKVGICTINDNDNYGNRLQNFAMQEWLKKNDLNPETIVNTTIHFKKEKITIKNFFPRLSRKIKNKSMKILKINAKRKRCFEEFNKNIIFYHKIIDDDKIKNNNFCEMLNSYFDIFITGSDQVWNPTFPRTSTIDFLTFAEKEKRNSYAASFGIDKISNDYKEKYTDYLNGLNHISVREDAGKNIVESLTGRNDVQVLIDPTMMLDDSDWDCVMQKPMQLNNFKGKKYILNYFLGRLSKDRMKEINRIARENDCFIINILDKHSPFYQTGPSEFLYLEKNAFLICTDSFHSCIFSLIFKTPFIVFNREDEYENMNSRLETFLKKFKLDDRVFNGTISNTLLKLDYSESYKILMEERKKSNRFINNIIEIGVKNNDN